MDLNSLKKRLPKASDSEVEKIGIIAERYSVEPTIMNFDGHGFRFIDDAKRTVRVCDGNFRDDVIHVKKPHSDIAVVFADGMLSGWIQSSKLTDIEDRMLVNPKSLNPMPDDFNFRQPCSHIEDHGGFYDGELFQCAGCGQVLVFNDKE